MQSIVWPSTYLTEIVFAPVPLTKQQKFGILLLASIYPHILAIKAKSSQSLSIRTACSSLLDQWTVQLNSGTYKWEKFILLSRGMRDNLFPCISTQMVTSSLLVLLIKLLLYGTLVLVSQSISSLAIRRKFPALNSNLLENIALRHRSMEPAAYGMLEWANAWRCSRAILMKCLILHLIVQEPSWLQPVQTPPAGFIMLLRQNVYSPFKVFLQ